MRISRWLGRENEENVARTRNCCGWPSSPPLTNSNKRLDVYWIQTDKQTDTQTSKSDIYRYRAMENAIMQSCSLNLEVDVQIVQFKTSNIQVRVQVGFPEPFK